MNIPLLIVILYVLLLFGISIYVSYSQKKDSENFLLYNGYYRKDSGCFAE